MIFSYSLLHIGDIKFLFLFFFRRFYHLISLLPFCVAEDDIVNDNLHEIPCYRGYTSNEVIVCLFLCTIITSQWCNQPRQIVYILDFTFSFGCELCLLFEKRKRWDLQTGSIDSCWRMTVLPLWMSLADDQFILITTRGILACTNAFSQEKENFTKTNSYTSLSGFASSKFISGQSFEFELITTQW